MVYELILGLGLNFRTHLHSTLKKTKTKQNSEVNLWKV